MSAASIVPLTREALELACSTASVVEGADASGISVVPLLVETIGLVNVREERRQSVASLMTSLLGQRRDTATSFASSRGEPAYVAYPTEGQSDDRASSRLDDLASPRSRNARAYTGSSTSGATRSHRNSTVSSIVECDTRRVASEPGPHTHLRMQRCCSDSELSFLSSVRRRRHGTGGSSGRSPALSSVPNTDDSLPFAQYDERSVLWPMVAPPSSQAAFMSTMTDDGVASQDEGAAMLATASATLPPVSEDFETLAAVPCLSDTHRRTGFASPARRRGGPCAGEAQEFQHAAAALALQERVLMGPASVNGRHLPVQPPWPLHETARDAPSPGELARPAVRGTEFRHRAMFGLGVEPEQAFADAHIPACDAPYGGGYRHGSSSASSSAFCHLPSGDGVRSGGELPVGSVARPAEWGESEGSLTASPVDILGARRTTLMFNRIPKSYTRDMLCGLIEQHGFAGEFDFVYQPVKFSTGISFGYAFVNFVSPDIAQACRDALDGFTDWVDGSSEVLAITPETRYQGRSECVEKYRNSPVMHASVDDSMKPALFDRGVRVPFPEPTRRLKPPRVGSRTSDSTSTSMRLASL